MRLLASLCLACLPLLTGCGSSPSGTNPNASEPAPKSTLVLDGNWEFAATPLPSTVSPSPLPSPVANFTGALHSADGKVTGTLRALATPISSQCVGIFTDLPASGIVDSAGNLTLNIAISGGTATISTLLEANLQTMARGTWQIVGGACAMPSTSMRAEQFAPVNGTFTGTFAQMDLITNQPVPGISIIVIAMLTQSLTPNADGQFPLAGTVNVAGSCTGTITITDGFVAGNEVESRNFDPIPQQPVTSIFNGAINTAATTVTGSLGLLKACGDNFYTGTLMKQ